ncbi:MAG: hypothetical protein IKU28_01350 [Erysipelotrichaceae bacterium]|nr:hypothetical protein [Erysipelotrichaceae bacterium]
MKKRKLKKGQTVMIVKRDINMNDAVIGDVGVIKNVYGAQTLCYSVEFKVKRAGYHDCDGDTKDGYGYFCSESSVEPFDETIVIYRNGDQVIALDKRTGERGVAKCSSDDIFDFDYGAELAFKRLIYGDSVKPIDKTIRVGDIVKIKKESLIYSTFDYWSGLGIWERNFIRKGYPDIKNEYVVLTVAPHDYIPDTLALIQHPLSRQVFIFSVEGLEKTESSEKGGKS